MTIVHDPYTPQIFTAQSGVPSVRLDNDDGTFLHLHSLVNPEQEADYYPEQLHWGEVLVFAGTGLGYHMQTILEHADNQKVIVLLEYYPELAAECALMVASVTGREPVVITRDTEDLQVVAQLLRNQGSIQVIRHPASWKAHELFYQEALTSITEKSPLKRPATPILFAEGTFFVERELGNAAECMGVNCAPFNYKKSDGAPAYEAALQSALIKGKPRCMVTVNMLGVDYNGMFPFYTSMYGVPSVHWFVDDPRPIVETRKGIITSDMIACTWERTYIPFLKECGFGRVEYLPLAVDATKPALFPVKTHERDLCFIGSSMGRAFLKTIADKCIWRREYENIARVVAEMVCDGATDDIDNLLREVAGKAWGDRSTAIWIRSYALHMASMMKRKKYIQALLPMNIELFGDESGWKELFGPLVATHPELDYQTQIAHQYNTTAVNLNITSCQMPTALNQRAFDVPYSGGFLLTDHQSDLDHLFDPGEYVSYENSEELIEKTRYYLEHEATRATVIAAACKRIIATHTYRHRLETILSWL